MIPTNETNKNKKKSPKKKNKKWHENPPAPCNTPVSDNMEGKAPAKNVNFPQKGQEQEGKGTAKPVTPKRVPNKNKKKPKAGQGNGSPEEAGSNQQQQVPESTNIKPNEKFNYKKGAKSGKNSAEAGGHSGGQKPQSNEGNLENPRNRHWKKKFNKKDKDGNQKQPDGSNKSGSKDEEPESPKENAKVQKDSSSGSNTSPSIKKAKRERRPPGNKAAAGGDGQQQQQNHEKKKSNSDTSNNDQTDGNVGVKPASSTSPSVQDYKATGPGKRNRQRQRRYTGNKLPGKDEEIPNCPKCKSPVSTKASIDPRENVTPPKVSGDIGTPSRPRDSPNRYDFRKVPAIPLISEKADSEGLLYPDENIPTSKAVTVPQPAKTTSRDPAPQSIASAAMAAPETGGGQALQDLTMAAYAYSPAAGLNKVAKNVKEQNEAGVNSPLCGGNLALDKGKGMRELPDATQISPPSSSSTMSGSKLQQILQDLTSDSSPPPSGGKPSSRPSSVTSDNPDAIVLKIDRNFVPLDVTANRAHVFCVSQPQNKPGTVQVFFKDGNVKGLLKLQERKTFNNPRSVVYIPAETLDTAGVDLAGRPVQFGDRRGYILVLDDQGIHVFLESGLHVKTLVTGDGEAANFRGLSYYTLKTSGKSQPDLFLVTLDISTPGEGVFLKVIDLNSPTQTGRRILVTKDRESELKCRFVACDEGTARGKPGCEAPRAYVTSMGTGRVYSVDLVDGTSTLMKFTQKALNDQDLMPPPPPSTKGPVERTFVDDMTRTEDPTQLETFEPFLIKEPTGIAVDGRTGDLFIADKAANSVFKFDRNGILGILTERTFEGIQTTQKQTTKTDQGGKDSSGQPILMSPIGIHLDSKEGTLFVASNTSRMVFVVKA